jgi:hypothetical protein
LAELVAVINGNPHPTIKTGTAVSRNVRFGSGDADANHFGFLGVERLYAD